MLAPSYIVHTSASEVARISHHARCHSTVPAMMHLKGASWDKSCQAHKSQGKTCCCSRSCEALSCWAAARYSDSSLTVALRSLSAPMARTAVSLTCMPPSHHLRLLWMRLMAASEAISPKVHSSHFAFVIVGLHAFTPVFRRIQAAYLCSLASQIYS